MKRHPFGLHMGIYYYSRPFITPFFPYYRYRVLKVFSSHRNYTEFFLSTITFSGLTTENTLVFRVKLWRHWASTNSGHRRYCALFRIWLSWPNQIKTAFLMNLVSRLSIDSVTLWTCNTRIDIVTTLLSQYGTRIAIFKIFATNATSLHCATDLW